MAKGYRAPIEFGGSVGSKEDRRKQNREGWLPWIENLEKMRGRALEMGGSERIERLVYKRGRMDPGTFVEIGQLVGSLEKIPGDAYVCGMGKIHGKPAMGGVEDFSVMGGSIGSGGSAKRYRIAELAMRERVPLVTMLDGAGHRLTDTGGGGRAPNDLLAMADLSGHVPMVCLILGAAAGHSALAAPLSDFVIMAEYSSMFTGGPPLVKAAIGEDVTKEELGGVKVCAEIAGSAHNVARDDAAAIDMARDYLSYLPLHAGGALPTREGPDTGPRRIEEMLEIIPTNDRQPYKMHEVLERVVDARTLFEVQPGYGRALITALAYMGGRAVAILANNPSVGAGALDSAAAIKAADFLDMVGRYGHPVIFLTDNPGVLAGTRAEREGILKWGGKMFHAERRLRNPKINVLLRKGFGFGLVNMAGTPFDNQTVTYSFPSMNLASMPAVSGGKSAKLDAETQAQVEAEQKSGPYRMANGMGVDDVIDPRDLRNALLNGLMLTEGRDG
jgi:acetyl-CoA carboxylase carboxyltransferase component